MVKIFTERVCLYLKSVWPWLMGLVIVVVGFWVVMRGGTPGYLTSDDNGNYFLGAYSHNYEALKQGKLALVNFHQALGNVQLGQGQSGTLYPPVYVGFGVAEKVMGNMQYGIDVVILLHWVLAVVGMWVWLSSLKVSKWLAWWGSVAYVLLPFGVGVGRNWIVVVYLVAYLPWNWWALERWLSRRGKGEVWWWVGIKTMLVLCGYVQWVVVSGVVEGVYLLIRAHQIKEQKSPQSVAVAKSKNTGKNVKTSKIGGKIFRVDMVGVLVSWIKIWLLVAMLSAPVLLPLWKTATRSVVRAESVSYQDFVRNSVDVVSFLKAQVGVFEDGELFDGSSFVYHLGLVWIVVAVWVVWKQRKKWSGVERALWWSGLVAGLCSTRLYGWLYQVSVVNWFRWPFKYVAVFEFMVLSGMMMGLGKWVGKIQRRKIVAVGGLMVGLGVNLGVIWVNRGSETSFSYHRVVVPAKPGWLETVEVSDGRVFSYGVTLDKAEDHAQLATFNMASVYGVNHFGGHDATLAMSVWEAIRGVPAFGALDHEFDGEMVEYLRSWGVKYWVSNDRAAAGKLVDGNEEMEVVWDGEEIVVEDEKAAPLVYWDLGEAVEYKFGVNRVEVEATRSGRLVFNVVYWPEYRAFEDGDEVEVKELTGRPVVEVGEGVAKIELVYWGTWFEWGVAVAMGGVLMLAGGERWYS